MKVLLVGSGAREHALAIAIAASAECERLVISPGNAGMADVGEIANIGLQDIEGLCSLAQNIPADLVVIGPEAPLAAGLVDRLTECGIACFGPSAGAAQIESSKAFAKAFMVRHGISTAEGKSFANPEEAKAWAKDFGRPLVVKASGLAAGKGVIVPENWKETEAAIERLAAEGEIVLEERLEGEELSLIALCDGKDYVVLPTARDHKRLLDEDKGPNTGGMGAYSPACSMEDAERMACATIAPALSGLYEEGYPYIGALYAGLMLTAEGAKVLEYNARLGDPETQVILPLFDSDVLISLSACAHGRLGDARPRFKAEHAACVVLASLGYPDQPVKGKPITIGDLPEKAYCLHAGTRLENGILVSSGGRVVSVLGIGSARAEALRAAYDAVSQVHFEGKQFRRDIGSKAERVEWAVKRALSAGTKESSVYAQVEESNPSSAYVRAGVDIDAGNMAVELMKRAVRSTYNSRVIAGIGAFGGQYDALLVKDCKAPVLVASTDGVGTKTSLALKLDRLSHGKHKSGEPKDKRNNGSEENKGIWLTGLGADIVNHSINDILVQGARPLFFMDYIAADKIDPAKVAKIVEGMSEACRQADCVLLGGETAEMPGTYREDEMDIAGTIVGIVERDKLLPRSDIAIGDVLIGLASSGLHTNGYSLARSITSSMELERVYPELGESLASALLRPHRSYLPLLAAILNANPCPIKALAHITGGGLIENIPRVLPPYLDAQIYAESWRWPALFLLLQRWGNVPDEEMRRVFNLGIGMVAIVEESQLNSFLNMLPEQAFVIGRLVSGRGNVVLV